MGDYFKLKLGMMVEQQKFVYQSVLKIEIKILKEI